MKDKNVPSKYLQVGGSADCRLSFFFLSVSRFLFLLCCVRSSLPRSHSLQPNRTKQNQAKKKTKHALFRVSLFLPLPVLQTPTNTSNSSSSRFSCPSFRKNLVFSLVILSPSEFSSTSFIQFTPLSVFFSLILAAER